MQVLPLFLMRYIRTYPTLRSNFSRQCDRNLRTRIASSTNCTWPLPGLVFLLRSNSEGRVSLFRSMIRVSLFRSIICFLLGLVVVFLLTSCSFVLVSFQASQFTTAVCEGVSNINKTSTSATQRHNRWACLIPCLPIGGILFGCFKSNSVERLRIHFVIIREKLSLSIRQVLI